MRLRALLALVLAGALGAAVASADVAGPDCTIQGTDRGQVIHGTPGPDVICGLGGDDTIYGEGGNDVIRGGSGDDRLLGGTGKDRFIGGDGSDLADYSPQIGAVRVSLGNGVADDGLNSGREQDDVTGDVEGVRGGAGADDLTGSAGDNLLSGGGGADILRGGAGADRLVGGAGGDSFFGGASPDTADYSAASGPVTASIGDGPNDGVSGEGDDVRGDVEYLQGSPAGDKLTGDGLANILYGGTGDDELHGGGGPDQLLGGLGADDLDGGAGKDLVTYVDLLTGGVKVTIGDSASGDGRNGGAEGDDVRASVERVIGTRFADDLSAASSGSSTLSGYLGNDTLRGGPGADLLDGHDGADQLSGGEGIDFFNGGQGTDTVLARDGGFDLAYCGTESDSYDADAGDVVDSSCETRRAFAVDDTAGTDEDTPVVVDVLANDEGDGLSVTSATTSATQVVSGGVKLTPSGFDHLAAGDTDAAAFDYAIAGTAGTDTGSVSVAIAGVNDPPAFAFGAASAYTEGDPATAIAPAVSVADVDDGDAIDGASVTIVSPKAGDALAMTDTSHIEGTFAAGVLKLKVSKGAPTAAEWSQALGSVTFVTSNEAPGASRSFTFKASDGTAEGIGTRSLAIAEVNSAPHVDAGPSGAYAAGAGPVPTAGALTLSDPDSATLTGATVQITGNREAAEDVLAYAKPDGSPVDGAFDTGTQTLVLSGDAPVAAYQDALRAVTYENTNADPANRRATLTFTATDDGGATGSGTRALAIEGLGPKIRNLETAALAYTENDPATPLSQTLRLEDPSSTEVHSARVRIIGGRHAEDELVATSAGGITATVSADKSQVDLTGTGTLDAYATAIRAVAYRNTSDAPSTDVRTIDFAWTDGKGKTSPAETRFVSVAAVADAPHAGDDTFDGAIGNTKLAVSTPSAAGPAKHLTGTVLDGDSDPDGDALTASSTDPDVNMASDGTFTYVPPAGEETSDTFDYTVSDGHGGTDTGTVTVNIDQPAIWYVDAAAPAGGDGRSNAPLQSTAPLNPGGSADGLDDGGDLVYLFSAPGAGRTYGDGLVLENGQIVRAQPAGLSVGGADLVQADGTLGPVSLTAPATGRALELAPNADVRNLKIVVPETGTGLHGDSAGGAAIAESSIVAGAGAVAVDLLNGGGAIDIDASIAGGLARITGRTGGSVSFPSTDVALDRIDAGGNANSHSITFARATVDATTAPAVSVSGGSLSIGGGGTSFIRSTENNVVNVGSGTGNVTIAPPVSTDTGRLVRVQGHQGGAITFSGAVSDTGLSRGISFLGSFNTAVAFTGATKEIDTGDGTAIVANDNTGTSSLTFSGGGLDVHSTNAQTFSAKNGGKVEVTGSGNKLTADHGEALVLLTTAIGAAGLTFERIDAAGGDTGIDLENTGTAGGLHVTGTGTPGSGGKLLGSPSYASLGIGVFLNNARDVTLEDMVIEDAWNDGIFGLSSRNVVVRDTTVRKSQDSNLLLSGHSGTATVTGSAFEDAGRDNVFINGSGGATTDVTFDDSVVDCPTATAGTGSGLVIDSRGTASAVVSDSQVRCAYGQELFKASAAFNGSMTLTAVRNTFANRVPTAQQASAAAGVRLQSSGDGPSLTFRLSENAISGSRGNAVSLEGLRGSTFNGSFQGTVARNTIGRTGVDRSGSAEGHGIDLNDFGARDYDVVVHDNTVLQVRRNGINLVSGNNAGLPVSPDVTITDNVTEEPPAAKTNPSNGLSMLLGQSFSGTYAACADVVGNNVGAYGVPDSTSGSDISLLVASGAGLRLPGFSLAQFPTAGAYVGAMNPSRPTPTVFTGTSGSTITGGSADCEQPPALPNVP
ncbi:MAG TPA: Ig-like domain-containing protein [Solirubrobacteraceae bacterium]